MRKFIGLLVMVVVLGAGVPARAQGLSNFMSSAHASSIGGNTLSNLQNVPINTSNAIQAPLPSTGGNGSFGFLSSIFHQTRSPSFPSTIGGSVYPTHGTYPTTNYQQLNWPYSNLFNITGSK
jgi:hypothetical protein